MALSIDNIEPLSFEGELPIWTETDAMLLGQLYGRVPLAALANAFGVSVGAIKSRASDMGLDERTEFYNRAEEIVNLYPSFSKKEIAAMLGVSDWEIRKVLKLHGILSDRERERAIKSRLRTSMIRRERRNINWGFRPLTKIKVFPNRRASTMRYRLNKSGYFVGRDEWVAYYDCTTSRSLRQEALATRLGFIFEEVANINKLY